jgi:hypothetical protein
MTGDGLHIMETAWQGSKQSQAFRKRTWPHQEKPNKNDWNNGRLYIQHAFLHRCHKLFQTLGVWYMFDKHWEWYCTDGSLYHFFEGTWACRNHLPTFMHTSNTCLTPNNPQCATIYFSRDRIVCSGFAPITHFKLHSTTCNNNLVH